MNIYTDSGLVKHAQAALKLKTKYMWGGILREITNAYIDMLSGIPAYKTHYPPERIEELRKCVGKGYYGVDCVGLIKSYYLSGKPDGGVGSPDYGKPGAGPDVNANAMYAEAKVKGSIKTLPEIPGIIVYCKSSPHVGVYIGNGWVIESTYSKRGDGVVKTKLSAFKWEYWFQCPYIKYKTTATVPAKIKKCVLAFPAKVRSEPKTSGKLLGRIKAGSTVTVRIGSEKTDNSSGIVYIRLDGEPTRWIIKTAIKQ